MTKKPLAIAATIFLLGAFLFSCTTGDWDGKKEPPCPNEIIDEESVIRALRTIGKMEGIGDYTPKYGRFQIVNIERVE